MKLLLFAMLVALVLAGCSVDNPIGREADNPQITTPADDAACILKPRPLALIAKYDETFETIKEPDFANNDPYAIIEIRGVGFCTHLGPSEIYLREQLNVSVYPVDMYADYISLTSISTGDKLEGYLKGSGYPSGNEVTFDAIFYITGGTGEFKNASGEAQVYGEGIQNPDGTGTGWVKFKGYFFLDSPV